MKSFKYLLFLCLLSPVVDCALEENGYFMLSDFWCAMHSREPSQVEYLVSWYFNKELTMQYNSTVGNWTGLTPSGLITAALLNNKHDLSQRKLEKQLICVNNVDLIFNGTEENIAKPNITLQAADHSSSHETLLVCSAYDFYPKYIKVTWHRNGQEVTEGVTSSDVLTNGDWTYQIHSYLEYTPGSQDKISCMVEHASLSEPKIHEWDSSLSWAERSFLAGGFCALILGGLVLSLGVIEWRRKTCDPQFSSAL